nr:PREDICTED: arginine/serine-rich protein 45-like [Equus przewalskii]
MAVARHCSAVLSADFAPRCRHRATLRPTPCGPARAAGCPVPAAVARRAGRREPTAHPRPPPGALLPAARPPALTLARAPPDLPLRGGRDPGRRRARSAHSRRPAARRTLLRGQASEDHEAETPEAQRRPDANPALDVGRRRPLWRRGLSPKRGDLGPRGEAHPGEEPKEPRSRPAREPPSRDTRPRAGGGSKTLDPRRRWREKPPPARGLLGLVVRCAERAHFRRPPEAPPLHRASSALTPPAAGGSLCGRVGDSLRAAAPGRGHVVFHWSRVDTPMCELR